MSISQVNNLTILSNKEIEIIDEDDSTTMAPLNVNGAVSVSKGIKIGFSDVSVPGLIIFDRLNFMGFNKNGWSLLSNNNEPVIIELNKDSSNDIEINFDDDDNYNIYINDVINEINLLLSTVEFNKIYNIRLSIINNTDNEININFKSNDGDIYMTNNNILIKQNEIIKFNAELIENDDNRKYLISYKNFFKSK